MSFCSGTGTRNVDNTCSGGGGGGVGPPGPPGPPGPGNPLSTQIFYEDYSEMHTGDDSFNFINITVTTGVPLKPPMIFNSASPTAGQTMLGTPNTAYAGPGIGAGGGPGPGANSTALGNLMIISDDNNPAAPKASVTGGTLTYLMTNIIDTVSIALINVNDPGWEVKLYDISNVLIATVAPLVLGLNSYQLLLLPYQQVAKMEIIMTGIGAVGKFIYRRPIAVGTTFGYIQLIDDGTLDTPIPPGNISFGSYQLMVESVLDGGAKAVFFATKATDATGGSLAKIVGSPNPVTLEQIQQRWDPSVPWALYHNVPSNVASGLYITYKYSMITII